MTTQEAISVIWSRAATNRIFIRKGLFSFIPAQRVLRNHPTYDKLWKRSFRKSIFKLDFLTYRQGIVTRGNKMIFYPISPTKIVQGTVPPLNAPVWWSECRGSFWLIQYILSVGSISSATPSWIPESGKPSILEYIPIVYVCRALVVSYSHRECVNYYAHSK